ncbi:MAG: hypothetical protein JJ992_19415, partial [Planctomycetes bacterium]|nr:hypothetical protein [Planctomycetota bacterium]
AEILDRFDNLRKINTTGDRRICARFTDEFSIAVFLGAPHENPHHLLQRVNSALFLSVSGQAEETETSLTSVVASSSIFSPDACATSCADTCTSTDCVPEKTCCLDSYLCEETWLDCLKNQKTSFSNDFTYSAGGTIRLGSWTKATACVQEYRHKAPGRVITSGAGILISLSRIRTW